MILFDSHCHLTDEAFEDDAPETVARAQAAGVAGIALCGYDERSNASVLRLAEGHQGVFPTVGYHPHEAGTVTAGMLDELRVQAALPQVLAVGEIGLDSYRGHSAPEDQRRVLDAQLDLALAVGKPVLVHSRGAEDAILHQLEPFARSMQRAWPGRVPGVMHCFGGTLEQARRYTGLGFLVSLSCAVTYPANHDTRAIAAGLPLESLLIETDSPYLPPQGKRGQRNEPALVESAARALAAARGISPDEAALATTRNACRLFGVSITEKAAVA
ncbi:MAG: TatD family hydrolase [Chloroflexi bacterium]|nr:TatD family hydrolase [Chloroflexota bacterium]